MKILITGCAGFIGFHLTQMLVAGGHDVVGVDNMNDYYEPALKQARLRALGIDYKGAHITRSTSGTLTFILAGVEDPALYSRHLDGLRFDAVCHLAAQAGVRYSISNPQQYISANLEGFFHILEYCRRSPSAKLVYASSSSVYGNSGDKPLSENDRTDSPVSLYAATKKANEVMAYSYSSLYGITTIGLRFFTVYGPWGRPDMAPFLFTKAILEGEPIKVFNGGDMQRDFTYVDDIVRGICLVLTEEPRSKKQDGPDARIYNIGGSRPVKLGDFISATEAAAGRKAEKIMLPMQPGDVRSTWADTSRLQDDYGYAPSTPLEEGLRRFVGWYNDFYRPGGK